MAYDRKTAQFRILSNQPLHKPRPISSTQAQMHRHTHTRVPTLIISNAVSTLTGSLMDGRRTSPDLSVRLGHPPQSEVRIGAR